MEVNSGKISYLINTLAATDAILVSTDIVSNCIP